MGGVLLWLVLLESFSALAAPRIVVLKSAELSAYGAVVAGFSAEARASVSELVLGEGADPGKLFEKITKERPSLVFALGPTAANAARRSLSEIPVVFAMVPHYEKYGLEGPKITGISMTSELALQLEALAAAFPKVKRVGVLADPRYSAGALADAKKAAAALNLSIVHLELDAPSKTPRVLRGAVGKLDALLMIADKTVAAAEVVQELISFCRKERLPLVALSPTQVKEGASFSLSASPSAIGQQAGRLARRIVYEKIDPGALSVAAPEHLELAVNLSALKNAPEPSQAALELFGLAARRHFAIKVFE